MFKHKRSFQINIFIIFLSVCCVWECQGEATNHDIAECPFKPVKHRSGLHRTDIYFAAFFPMGAKTKDPESSIGHGVMPAVKLAIKHINQSPNILRGYKLHMYWNDTKVSDISCS